MYTKLLPGLLMLIGGGVLFWYAANELILRIMLTVIALWLMKYGLKLFLPMGLCALALDD